MAVTLEVDPGGGDVQDAARHQRQVHLRTVVHARVHELHADNAGGFVGGDKHPFTRFDVRTPRAVPVTLVVEQFFGCVRLSLDSGVRHQLQDDTCRDLVPHLHLHVIYQARHGDIACQQLEVGRVRCLGDDDRRVDRSKTETDRLDGVVCENRYEQLPRSEFAAGQVDHLWQTTSADADVGTFDAFTLIVFTVVVEIPEQVAAKGDPVLQDHRCVVRCLLSVAQFIQGL